MSKRSLIGRVACQLALHDWKIEKRGRMVNGSVYVLTFRVCRRCELTEQETLDRERNEVTWICVPTQTDSQDYP